MLKRDPSRFPRVCNKPNNTFNRDKIGLVAALLLLLLPNISSIPLKSPSDNHDKRFANGSGIDNASAVKPKSVKMRRMFNNSDRSIEVSVDVSVVIVVSSVELGVVDISSSDPSESKESDSSLLLSSVISSIISSDIDGAD